MYTPLDETKKEIRLLHLLPGQKDDPIQCHLETISLATPSHPPFEALSYVWGASTGSHHLHILDHEMPITDNLSAALQHLRHPHSPRTLWIDALCINQTDLAERQSQVRIMGAIYRRAALVVAWTPQYGGRDIVSAIRAVGADQELHWIEAHRGDREADRSIDVSAVNLKLFFSDAWFARVWTLQEAVLAKDLVYVCREDVLTAAEVDGMMQSFRVHLGTRRCCSVTREEGGGDWHNVGREVQYVLDEVRQMDEMRKKCAAGESAASAVGGFLDVVAKTRHRNATDPRDKIYGLFALAGDLDPGLIDYGAPVAEVYVRTALWCITSTGTLDVLSHKLPSPTAREVRVKGSIVSKVDGLPSWAPNWEDPVRYYRLMRFHRRQSLLGFYKASGDSIAQPILQDEGRRLELRGVFCNRIAAVGKKYEDHWDQEYDVYENWRDMAGVDVDPNRPYPDGRCTQLEAYWRTLCNDIDPTGLQKDVDGYARADATVRYAHDRWWWSHLAEKLGEPAEEQPGMRVYEQFHGLLEALATGRRFFLSEKGYMGMALADAQPGDEIWVLQGGKVPYVLRPQDLTGVDVGGGRTYTLVGDAYVHGVMDGELFGGEHGTIGTLTPIYLQ